MPSGREFVGALDYQYNDISEYTKYLLLPGPVYLSLVCDYYK